MPRLPPQQFCPTPCGFSPQEPRVPREGNAVPLPLLFPASPRCRVTPGKAPSVGRGRPAGRAPCRLRLRGRVGSRALRRECGARDLLRGRAQSVDPGSEQEAKGEPRSYLRGPGAAPGARATAATGQRARPPADGSALGAAGSALLTGLHRGPARAVPLPRLSPISALSRTLGAASLGPPPCSPQATPGCRDPHPLVGFSPLLPAGVIPNRPSTDPPDPARLSFFPRATELCMESHSNHAVTFRHGVGGWGGKVVPRHAPPGSEFPVGRRNHARAGGAAGDGLAGGGCGPASRPLRSEQRSAEQRYRWAERSRSPHTHGPRSASTAPSERKRRAAAMDRRRRPIGGRDGLPKCRFGQWEGAGAGGGGAGRGQQRRLSGVPAQGWDEPQSSGRSRWGM